MSTADDRGQPWPPECERDRLRRYAMYEALYRGNHQAVFTSDAFGYKPTRRPYVYCNYLRSFTQLVVARAFGDGVRIIVPESETGTQEFVDWLDSPPTRLQLLLRRVARTASYAGDAFVKIAYVGARKQLRIEEIHPTYCYPEWSDVTGDMTAVSISKILARDEMVDRVMQPVYYLWTERNEMRDDGLGWVSNRMWRMSGSTMFGTLSVAEGSEVGLDTFQATAGLPVEECTGVPCLLVVHFPNHTIGDDHFGTSDYTDIASLQAELNHRATHVGGILDIFARPKVIGPMLLEASDPRTGERDEIDMSEFDYIENASADAKLEIIEWNGELGASRDTMRDLTDWLANTAGTERSAMLSEVEGVASGTALRLRQHRTQTTAKEIQQLHEPSIQDLIRAVTALASLSSVVIAGPRGAAIAKPVALDQGEIVLGWGDGLPADELADVEKHEKLVAMGVESKAGAAEALFGLSPDEAAQMVDKAANDGDMLGWFLATQGTTAPVEGDVLAGATGGL